MHWLRYLIAVKKITISSVLLLFVMLCLYKYVSDEAEWRQAEDALVRLQSGMQYESMLMVRSRLADADAAVEEFRSGWRIFPLKHDERVSDAKRGISYLSLALDWNAKAAPGKTSDSEPSDGAALAEYPDVTKFVSRWCENGQLVFNPRIAASGFEAHGDHWLLLAEGKADSNPVGPNPPLDWQKENQACEQQQLATARAQTAALEARLKALQAKQAAEKAAERAAFLAKYPYEVQLLSSDGCSFTLYMDGQMVIPSLSLYPGAQPYTTHMQRSDRLELNHVRCKQEPPEHAIEIQVNGSKYSANWSQEGKASPGNPPNYQTTIAPGAPK